VKQASRAVDVSARPYVDGDETAVLGLLNASLGAGPAGERPPEFFRWKHLDNPFGRSFMIVAEVGADIVGLRAFMRWEFVAGDRKFRAVRAVDTATHPDFQGLGIFSHLTKRALSDLEHEADFIFNTPNEKSLGGYLKMGWHVVGNVPISIRVRRPLGFITGGRHHASTPDRPIQSTGLSAREVLLSSGQVSEFLDEVESFDNRLNTPRKLDYLRWRYADAPLLGYRAVTSEKGDRLNGIGIFRVRPRGGRWESTISELLVRSGDQATAKVLLTQIVKSAAVDHAACHFPPGGAASAGATRAGFLRAPGGMTFVAKKLHDDVEPDPNMLENWAFSVGDLEVF
jgi:GNAT superfamily N-acetyltransferase